MVRVKSHTRRSKKGKLVRVKSYTRSKPTKRRTEKLTEAERDLLKILQQTTAKVIYKDAFEYLKDNPLVRRKLTTIKRLPPEITLDFVKNSEEWWREHGELGGRHNPKLALVEAIRELAKDKEYPQAKVSKVKTELKNKGYGTPEVEGAIDHLTKAGYIFQPEKGMVELV